MRNSLLFKYFCTVAKTAVKEAVETKPVKEPKPAKEPKEPKEPK